jgi:hypothetical protein
MRNLRPKGNFTLKATDTKTGKVRVVEKGNAAIYFSTHIYPYHSRTGLDDYYCHYTADKLLPDVFRTYYLLSDRSHNSSVTNTIYSDYREASVTDFYFEKTYRFDSTGSTHAVNTVFLSSSSSSADYVYCYAVLSSEFIQGETEVLDITYRLSFETSSLPIPQALKTAFNLYRLNQNSGYNTYFYSKIIDYHIHQQVLNQFSWFYALDSSSLIEGYVSAVGSDSSSFSKTDSVGSSWRTLIRFLKRSSDYPVIDAQLVLENNDSIPTYPLSPLFNHSYNAGSAFEDVSYLASGLGYPFVTVDNNPTYLDGQKQEQYIFAITKSGNVGTARYEFKRISKVGGIYPSKNLSKLKYSFDSMFRGGTHPNLNHASGTDINLNCNTPVLAYNGEVIVYVPSNSTVQSGILLINNIDPSVAVQWDKGTTPPFPQITFNYLTSYYIRSAFTRDSAGNIYICHINGLLRVGDPLGTAVFTNYSLSTLGMTQAPVAVDAHQSRVVCINNNKEVAMSSDNGDSWVGYSCSNLGVNIIDVYLASNDYSNRIFYTIADSGNYNICDYDCLFDVTTNTAIRVFTTSDVNYYSTQHYSVGKGGVIGNTTLSIINLHKSSYDAILIFNHLDNEEVFLYGDYSGYNADGYVITSDGLGNPMVILPHSHYYDDNKMYANAILNLDGILIAYYPSNDWSGVDENSGLVVHVDEYNEQAGISPSSASGQGQYPYYTSHYRRTSGTGNIFNTSGKQDCIGDHLKSERQIYRWNSSNWELNFNRDTDATGEGSSSAKGIRKNFDTDANRFNGGCSLDISNAVNSADYASNGMTVLITATNDVKHVPSFSGSNWDTYLIDGRYENPLSCLFELTDTATGRGIALMFVSYNDKTALIDNTDILNPVYIDLETQPASSQNRYALTLSSDGTTVNVYKGGIQIGSTITLTNAMNMSAAYDMSIGSRNRCRFKGVVNYGANYKGTIENIQVFNNVLSSTDLNNDAGSPLGLVSSTDLVVRYLMTMDYNEGKVTHSSAEPTVGGVSIGFDDGDLSADSYTEFDNYLCYKVEGGFIKDNVSTFNRYVEQNMIGKKFTTATSPVNGSTTIPDTAGVITERVLFNPNTSGMGSVGVFGIHNISGKVIPAIQTSTGDLIAEFTVNLMQNYDTYVRIGNLSDFGSSSSTHYTNLSTIKFEPTSAGGNVRLYDETGTEQILNGETEIGTKIKVEWIRSSDVTKVYKWDGSNWVQLGSDLSLQAANVGTDIGLSCFVYGSGSNASYLNEFNITYTCSPNLMYIGDKTAGTGVYDSGFIMGTNTSGATDSLVVKLAGVEATQNIVSTGSGWDYNASNVPANNGEPPAGSYNFYCVPGILQFNSADAGKVVSIHNAYLQIRP